jgi:hypothetical protein
MRWFFMSSSKKTESLNGFSCLQVRKTISWCCLLTWRHLMMLSSHLQPSHDAVFLLDDIKSHLMILPSYLKTWKTISWFCHSIMRWLFMSSSKKTESWDGFSCLQVRRQHHEMAFHVLNHLMMLSSYLKTSHDAVFSLTAISWFCLLTWRH